MDLDDELIKYSMQNTVFKAYVVEEKDGHFTGGIKERRVADLPEGDLLIRVHYSSLNYKDALSASGNRGVTRRYPHTPGIDAAGTVVHSDSDAFQVSDKVIVTGYDLGMNTDGGFGQYIRIPAGWAIRLPGNLSMREAMMFGTAGLTAGTGVMRIIEDIGPEDGPVVVSGATGGVGSLGVAILSKLGYHVVAVTGKEKEKDFLVELGAKEVILRKELEEADNRPLRAAVYAGALDTAGGPVLEHILASTKPFGVVTCCGNVAGANLNLTVYPFILRGITLYGIASQNYPKKDRERIWNKLAGDWKPEQLSATCEEIGLDTLGEKIALMLGGKLTGRKLLNMDL
jgi:putative YhdH/YhfP family quinone oxidoreductase